MLALPLCALPLPCDTEGGRGRGGARNSVNTRAKSPKKRCTCGGHPWGGTGTTAPLGPSNPEPPRLPALTGRPFPATEVPREGCEPPPPRVECTALGCAKTAGWVCGNPDTGVCPLPPRPVKCGAAWPGAAAAGLGPPTTSARPVMRPSPEPGAQHDPGGGGASMCDFSPRQATLFALQLLMDGATAAGHQPHSAAALLPPPGVAPKQSGTGATGLPLLGGAARSLP